MKINQDTINEAVNDAVSESSVATAHSALQILKLCRSKKEAEMELALWIKQLEAK